MSRPDLPVHPAEYHAALKADTWAFESVMSPLVRHGVHLRQHGARLYNCTCGSTFVHPDDRHLITAYLDAEEADERRRAQEALERAPRVLLPPGVDLDALLDRRRR